MALSDSLCYILNDNFEKLNRVRPIYHNVDSTKINSPVASQLIEFERGPLEWKFYENILTSVENKTMLDVGCGYGGRSVYYALKKANIVAIDFKADKFKTANLFAKQKQVEERVNFQVANAVSLPFDSNTFDIVMSNNVMPYISPPLAGLNEFKRVVKPDGLICINFGPPWRAPMCPETGTTFPWTHLLFSQDAIIKAYIKMGKGDFFKNRYDNIYKYINKLTIKSYHQLLASADLDIICFKLWTRPYVAPFLHIPFLKEYFCAQIISVTRKKTR